MELRVKNNYTQIGIHPVTCMIWEDQLRLFTHVAQFSKLDSVYCVHFSEDLVGMMDCIGQPQVSHIVMTDEISCGDWD